MDNLFTNIITLQMILGTQSSDSHPLNLWTVLWCQGLTAQFTCLFLTLLHTVAEAQAASKLTSQYFQLVQVLKAPVPTNPSRLPVCVEIGRISKLLAANINEQYASYMRGKATVATSYVQVSSTLGGGVDA